MTQVNMLARYKILDELGRGAIGAVYAARDRETGGVVALKRLDLALLGKPDANAADRFLKHARSARLLRHRNIVAILDAGEVAGTVYVAMEMLEGESLRRILDGGPLPIARAIQIAREIACGLAHAHLEGVVHGGLKPSEIIVSRSGEVKITDFGIGRLGQAALLSEAPTGGLRYASPEQARGEPVDHRCDIFSLGALFYEMLTHRAPFAGDCAKEIVENILHAKPPLPSELNPHVPRALDGIIFSMLAGHPAARMPGVPILLRELQGLEEGLGLGSGPGAGSDDRAPRADSPAAEEIQHRDRTADGEAFDCQTAIAVMERESRRERSPGARAPIFAALALVLAVLGIGVAGFTYYTPDSSARGIATAARDLALQWLADRSRMQAAPATAQMVSRAIAPAPVANAAQQPANAPAVPVTSLAENGRSTARVSEQRAKRFIGASKEAPAPGAPDASPPLAVGDGQVKQEPLSGSSAANSMLPEPVARAPRPSEQTEKPAARASEQLASAGTAPALPRAKQPSAEIQQQQRGGMARVILSVSPRGEIYIDGKHHGTTPPITTFDLEPGMHRIEVRSGSRSPYLTYVTVQTGDVRRIRHDFDVSRAVHPPKSASWQKSNRAAR